MRNIVSKLIVFALAILVVPSAAFALRPGPSSSRRLLACALVTLVPVAGLFLATLAGGLARRGLVRRQLRLVGRERRRGGREGDGLPLRRPGPGPRCLADRGALELGPPVRRDGPRDSGP